MAGQNIKHWYDGRIYTLFIAPFQRSIFQKISDEIEEGSSVLDIASGTGEFSIMTAGKCSKVTGVDLSVSNIRESKKRALSRGLSNLDFIHYDASKLEDVIDDKYDYAVVTFAIHEMPEEMRTKVLKQMQKAANTVIIADYVSPMPKTPYGIGVRVIEYFAGREHYKGYLSYQKKGGLDHYIEKTGFAHHSDLFGHNGHSRIAVLKSPKD